MKISALAPWFGSKRTLAPRIVEVLGPHRAYWEPFCGSLAVLLAKPVVSQETVNDLHGDIVNLARTLKREETAAWLYGAMLRTLPSEELFRESCAWLAERGPIPDDPDDDDARYDYDPQRAYHFLVSSWLGRNGVIGTAGDNNSFCVRSTRPIWSKGRNTSTISPPSSTASWPRPCAASARPASSSATTTTPGWSSCTPAGRRSIAP